MGTARDAVDRGLVLEPRHSVTSQGTDRTSTASEALSLNSIRR